MQKCFSEKSIIVISNQYPFGLSEVFVERELTVISPFFNKVFLLPQQLSNHQRSLPHSNIVMDTTLFNIKKKKAAYLNIFMKHIFIISTVIFIELFRSGRIKYIIKQSKFILYKTIKCIQIGEAIINLQSQSNLTNRNSIYYSIWMDDGALVLALLKARGKISNFYIRLHGYDLFDYRRDGNYMPFRAFIFKHATKISVQTQEAYDYLIQKNLFAEKIEIHRQGVFDEGTGPFDNQLPLKIVSCSNLYKSKRVDLIMGALQKVHIPVEWIHFGDGPEQSNLIKMVNTLPKNIRWEFKGRVPNDRIIQFYKENIIHLFIHLSDTEGGVPVAILEAASFGIPILGNKAGGIPEIVNEQTGKLLGESYQAEEIADFINDFPTSKYNTQEFRESVKLFWLNNFEANKNYRELYQNLFIGNKLFDANKK